MDKTVVAVFDDQDKAKSALATLISGGFPSTKARLTSRDSTSSGTTARKSDEDESLGEKIAAFFGLGDDEATYSEAVRRGSCVLTVDAASDEEAERATDIINEFDPVDIDERAAQWNGKNKNSEKRIDIVEEQLQVGKREVQKGGVRVVSRVTERPVEEKVTLREEHATVKRRPADRAVSDSDTAFKDQSFEVRGTAEEAVVGKTARVVEEVVIGKEGSSREQTVKGNVRRTDVDVQQMPQSADSMSLRDKQPKFGGYNGSERRTQPNSNYRGPERRYV